MESKIHFFLILNLIFGNNPSLAKALIGSNVRPVLENEFPGVVCIASYNPDFNWQWNLICTGTLISPTHVLTAEHCFEGIEHQVEISVGNNNIDEGERHYPIWWISYDQWIVHTGQQSHAAPNDILLVKIFGLPINNNYFSMGSVYPSASLYGSEFVIVGCGRIANQEIPLQLRAASITIIDHDECVNRVSALDGSQVQIPNRYICSFNNPYTLLQMGDSGGPLLYCGVLVGISTSVCPRINGQNHPGQVNIHLNLYYYQHFIYDLMYNT